MEDISNLAAEEQSTLEQYISVTNEQAEEAIPILRNCQWNIQYAITQFYDGVPTPTVEAYTPLPDSRRHDTLISPLSPFETLRRPRYPPAPRVVPNPNRTQPFTLFFPFNIILAPFSLVAFLFTQVFSSVAPFLPFLPALMARFQSPPPPKLLTTQETAERFKDGIEEKYGPIQLPFLRKGYTHSLDDAKRDLKFLLVVLISLDHDDTEFYIKETLGSDQVSRFIQDKSNHLLLWGGNIRDTEGYQVSTAFGAKKFPYAALLAHDPKSNSRSASYASKMSIIATLVGPIAPSDFLSKVRLAIQSYDPELSHLRLQRSEREATRSMRADQDSAYERSLARDRERARKKKEMEDKKRMDAENAAKAKHYAHEQATKRHEWKLWRASRIKPEPESESDADLPPTRVSIRLPDGNRIIRRFSGTSSVEEIYAVVECWDNLLQEKAYSQATRKPANYEHEYKFQLISPLPREVHSHNETKTISKAVGRSANLLVETLHDEAEDDGEILSDKKAE